MSERAPRTLLFHRHSRGPSGGHLKVRDYYEHARQSATFEPRIHFASTSDAVPVGDPWAAVGPVVCARWAPEQADALFLAGLDWQALPAHSNTPVINLIQGVRHADPDDPRYPFLVRPAIRICVSPEVTSAITGTGRVNGPVFTINNGLDVGVMPLPSAVRDLPVLIMGQKNPALARDLAVRLLAWGVPTRALTQWIPRADLFAYFGRAQVVLTLPNPKEGFFLPALEAMAMGAVVVCPDCRGNRGFCLPDVTCLVPEYSAEALAVAVRRALSLEPSARASLLLAAANQVQRHGITRERRAFLAILDGLSGDR